MEFNDCTTCSSDKTYYGYRRNPVRQSLFDELKQRFESYGYKMPRLVFWNVNSRTDTIPVKENDLGVALVSGYSINIVKMVLKGELDPYKNLLKTLFTERYAPILNLLNK